MADRYWRGGTGTWNTTSTTNWSTTSNGSGGASVPTAADNVIFDQAATYTVTMTGALACLSITVSAGTVTFATGTGPTLAISGDMSLDAATVWNSTGTITFNSTTARTITTNGVTIRGAITFNGVGGNWSLGSALTLGATLTTTLTNGTITLNGFTLTTGIFSSSNTNTRSIAFGSTDIVLAHTSAAQVVLSMATLTGFTYTGTGGFTATMSVTRTFTCGTTGGTSANAPNLTFTTGASVATITTAGFFNKLDYGTTTFTQAASTLNVNSITLSSTGTYTALILNLRASGTVTYNGKTTAAVTLLTGSPTIADTVTCTTFTVNGPTFDFTSGTINPSTSFVLTSGSFTLNGGTLGAVPTFTHTAGAVTFNASYATTVTGTYTLTAGTLTLADGVTLSAGIFSSTGTGVRSIAFGSASAGNINLTRTTAASVVLSMAVVTNFTNTGPGGFTVADMANTRTFTFGTTGGSTSNAVNLTFTTGASIATLTTAGWFKNLDFGTTGFNPGTTTLNIAGNLTLSATGTYTTTTINPLATATYVFNGRSLGPFTVNTVGVTITMGSAGGCTILTVTQGTVDLNGQNFTCSSTATVNSGGTLSNFGTFACTTFTNNGSTVSLSSGAINASVSIVQSSGSFTIGAATIGATPLFTHTAGTVTFNSSQSLAVTGTYTFTAGTLTLADYVTLSTGIFSSSNTNTRAIAFGSTVEGNINLTHTTATTVVLSMGTVTGFTYTGPGGFTVADMANTRTLTYGTTGGSISNAVNLTFTTGASVATLTTAGWFKNLNFGTTSFNPGTTALSIAGALTLSSTGTYTGLTFTPLTSATYTFNGASVGAIAFNYSGITITMGSAGACTTLTMTAGTIDFAGYDFTCSGAATYNSTGTLLNFGTFACTTFTNNGATLSLTSGAINASTSFVQSSGSFTVGGSATIGATPLFTHTAGTVTFNTSQSLAVTGTYTFTAGTLNIDDNVTLSTGIFSSTNTNSRTINFGLTTSPGYIALTHTTAATVVLNIAIMTGLTVNALGKFALVGQPYWTQAAGGFISNTSVTKTFTCGTTGGNSANAPCLRVLGTGATQLPTFTTGSWFGDFVLSTDTMTIAATTLNINTYVSSAYYNSINTTSMNLNFVGSGVITNPGDTSNTFGILGAVTINHSGTTAMIYDTCPATTVAFTAGTLECRAWANGPFGGYGQFVLTGAFTQTGGSWYNNAVYIANCTTYTINGPTISSDTGLITATTSMVLTSGSFTFNGGTISAIPLFTHTAGTVTIKANQTVSLATTGTYTFTSGSLIIESPIGLDTGLYTGIFSSSGTGVRSITFGQTAGAAPAFINLTHTTPGTTVLSMATVTNFTWTAAYDPAINVGDAGFKSDMVNTRTFVFGTTGGSITNSPNLIINGSSTPTITTGSWFNILNFIAAQTFTLPATSLNLNSIIPGSGYGTISLANLTANMRGPGFLDGGSSLGAVVINNGSNVTQVRSNFFAPVYSVSAVNCTTLTITAGTLDGGIQTFTGSCTAGVLTTVGSPTLVPGSVIYSSTVGSGPVSYVGIILSGSGNSWLLTTPSTSFVSATLATNCSIGYSPAAGITCSGAVTWTGGSLTNFGKTDALTAGGSSSLLLTCTTFTVNGPTFDHTLQNGGTINPSTSFVLTSGSYTLNGGVLGAVPTFTQTSGPVTFNYNYSLTTTGTYTLTAGALTLATGVTLATGIFSSTGAGTRSIGFGASVATPSGAVYIDNSPSFQYLSVPSNAALGFGTGDFTFECWTYLSSITSATPFIAGQSSDGFCFWYDNGFFGYDTLRVSTTGGSNLLAAGWAPTLNQWYHLAVSRSGTTLRLFINGTVAATATDSTDFSTSDVTIGANPTGLYAPVLWSMQGAISNLRIVKGVAVYTSTFTPPTLPLTATQSANTNGNPSAAITGAQTSLLLNTSYGSSFLTDSSTYGFTVTNNNGATNLRRNPFTGDINLTHTTAATVVLNMAALGGFSWTGSGGFTVADMANTRTLSVGSTSGGSTTTAVNLTFTTGASVATLTTASWFNTLDFGTTSFTLGTTTLNINGGLTLSSSGTYTGLTPSFRSDSTLTSNGKTVAALVVNAPTYTLTTNDATSITGTLTLTTGAVVAPYNITSGSFSSVGPYAKSITGSTTTYTLTGGATAWNLSSKGSALFNGSTQYLTVPDNAAFVFTGDFTMEAWIYPTSFGGINGNVIAAHWPGAVATDCAWIFQITSTGKVSLAYGIGATNTTVTGTSLSCSLNVWTHVAVTRSGSTVNFFVNGVADATAPTVSGSLNDSTAVVSIGRSNATDQAYFTGYITNVRLVKGVAVYTGNFTVPTAPLLPTQSADTNISAITGSQTSLLLSTPSTSFLTDYSVNNFTVTNVGTATANILSPFAVTSPGITFTGFTINMTSASAKTFAGGGTTYPTLNQGGAGALTISGNNSFGDLTATTRPSTITFTISTTQTFTDFTLSGTAGNLVTINSSSAGTQATLSKSNGAVSVGYLSIRDSNATGGATWQAGATSTNVSNNTGWVFGGVIYTAGGLFFAFF